MQNEQNIQKIDIMHLLDSALRHIKHTWLWALLLMVLFGGLGTLNAKRVYYPLYKVHASFVVNAASGEQVTANYTNKETAKQLNETFPYILTSGALGKIVANDLGTESIPAHVTAEALGDVNLFRMVVTGKDPQVCMDVLDSVIKNYPQVAKYILGTTTLELINKSKLPTEPYNKPNFKRNAIRYALYGLILYLIIVIFRALLSRTVYSKSMLEKYISIPYLGSIPRIGSSNRRRRNPIQISGDAVSAQYREALETLRVRIGSKMKHNNWKSLYVTSSMASEGKTTITCNLAVLMAQHGNRVLLIDGDLRNPSVSKTLGLDRDKDAPGMNEYLNGELPFDKLITKCDVPMLMVFPGGVPVDRVSDQFSNGRFETLIKTCKNKFDYVIVDTPPCAMLDDAAVIAEYMEGGLLVVHKDYTSIDAVIAGSELMAKTNAPLFGCTLNFASEGWGQ